MQKQLLTLTALGLATAAGSAGAAVIVAYDFESGSNPNQITPTFNGVAPADMVVSGSRDQAVNGIDIENLVSLDQYSTSNVGGNGDRDFVVNGFYVRDGDASNNPTERQDDVYLAFTYDVTAPLGVELEDFDFGFTRFGSGPNSLQVGLFVGGTNVAYSGEYDTSNNSNADPSTQVFSFDFVDTFVANGSNFELRFYGFDPSDATGGNSGGHFDDLVLTGTVVIPEPATAAAGLVGLGLLAARRRRI
jgi:hypothetical protein